AVGHASTALEHGQGLIENLLEGHGRPSTALTRVPRQRHVRHGGVSRENTPRVYQESGGVAGKSAPPGRAPTMGRTGSRWHVSETGTWPVALGHLHAQPPEH